MKDKLTSALKILLIPMVIVTATGNILFFGMANDMPVAEYAPPATWQPYTGISVADYVSERMEAIGTRDATETATGQFVEPNKLDDLSGECVDGLPRDIMAELAGTEAAEETETEPTPRYILSDEERNMIMYVADREDFTNVDSRLAVMTVIMNRVESESFPDTVRGVLYQAGQFNVMRGYYEGYVPSAEATEAMERLIDGEDIVPGALYFAAWYVNPEKIDKGLELVAEYGGSKFWGKG